MMEGDKLCLRGIESNEPIRTPFNNVVKVGRKTCSEILITHLARRTAIQCCVICKDVNKWSNNVVRGVVDED